LDQARGTMTAIQVRLNKSDPERFVASQASVFPVAVENTSKDLNLSLYVLLGAVGLLLLIGCSNLANLTLVRAARRAREISICRALGASRGRIIGRLVTESLLLSMGGAAVGLLLSKVIKEGLLKFHLPVPRPEDIEMTGQVFAFATAVSLLTTLLFGLAPAISVSNIDVNEALKAGGRPGAWSSRARGRQVLTTAQVSLALILLCGSGLLIRSFVKVVQTGLGFKTQQLSVTNIDLPDLRYPNAASRARFYDALVARARVIYDDGVSRRTL
jgi:putative ABC transport system permease protein